MLIQKRRDQMKQWEKQDKKLKEMKASGKSTKQAVSQLKVKNKVSDTFFY